jgi:serine/threonine protein kinase
MQVVIYVNVRIFLNEDEELDLQNRGTEYIKSPEMLNLAFSNKRNNENFDRRRRCGTTRSSDIWSLGCLFYELLTGKWLFFDLEFFKFYIRVTNKDNELLTDENRHELHNNSLLIGFLSAILVRNPMHRPTIEHLITKFQQMMTVLTGKPVKSQI